MDSERQSSEQAGNARIANSLPCYQAYRISEGKWGIVFRLDQHTSWDEKVVYPTKRRAVAIAALLNQETTYTTSRAEDDLHNVESDHGVR